MLTLLEVTGGRRSEVAALTVESVWQAARMEYPMLKLLTVKRAGGRDAHRLVPIARHDLVILIEFIEKNRRRVVRTTCGLDADDGVVLVSETTGHGLSDNTITQEIHKLRRHSGIEEQACPHMFRHRFITKLFVALIEQHHLENQDEIRRALLDAETMKQKIQQWTGHKDLRSLDTYINLAFEETANFKKIFNLVSAQRVVGSFATRLEEFQQELLNGASPTLMVEHLVKVVAALREDLEYLKEEPACSNPSS
jgi:site-specific recombinase XerD